MNLVTLPSMMTFSDLHWLHNSPLLLFICMYICMLFVLFCWYCCKFSVHTKQMKFVSKDLDLIVFISHHVKKTKGTVLIYIKIHRGVPHNSESCHIHKYMMRVKLQVYHSQ